MKALDCVLVLTLTFALPTLCIAEEFATWAEADSARIEEILNSNLNGSNDRFAQSTKAFADFEAEKPVRVTHQDDKPFLVVTIFAKSPPADPADETLRQHTAAAFVAQAIGQDDYSPNEALGKSSRKMDGDRTYFDPEMVLVKVEMSNKAPIVSAPKSQTTPVGEPVQLLLKANDPEGEPLTFTATGLPPGLTINLKTGMVSGAALKAGTYEVLVKVSDPQGAMEVISFGWGVAVRSGIDPFSVPTGLSMDYRSLLSLLGYANSCEGQICQPAHACLEMVVKAIRLGYFQDAAVLAEHGLKFQDRPELHFARAVALFSMGECSAGSDALRPLVRVRQTDALLRVMERLSGPAAVRAQMALMMLEKAN